MKRQRLFFLLFIVIGFAALAIRDSTASVFIRHVLKKVSDLAASGISMVPGEIAYDEANNGVKVQFESASKNYSTVKIGESDRGMTTVYGVGQTVRLAKGSIIVLSDGSIKKILADKNFSTLDINSVSPFSNGWNYLWYRVNGSVESLYATQASMPPRATQIYASGKFGYVGVVYIIPSSASSVAPFKKLDLDYTISPGFTLNSSLTTPASPNFVIMFPASATYHKIGMPSVVSGSEIVGCYVLQGPDGLGEENCVQNVVEYANPPHQIKIKTRSGASVLVNVYTVGFVESADDYRKGIGGTK